MKSSIVRGFKNVILKSLFGIFFHFFSTLKFSNLTSLGTYNGIVESQRPAKVDGCKVGYMKKLLFAALSLIFLQSCSEPDDKPKLISTCEHVAVVDNIRYKAAQPEGYRIKDVQIVGDCLSIEVESSGCDGETWEVTLLDADRVSESNPEQRDLKLVVNSKEFCSSIIQKTFTFDLRPIRTPGNAVLLNLELWDEQIVYEY